MGSAAVQAPFVPVRRCSSPLRRPSLLLTLHSSSVRSLKCSALTSPSEKVKDSRKKSLTKGKQSKRVKAVSLEAEPVAVSSSSQGTGTLNYDEVTEQLENIYKLSPTKVSEKIGKGEDGNFGRMRLVRGNKRKAKRLTMEKRTAVKKAKSEGTTVQDDYVERLLVENLVFWNLSSLDWRRMKMPPVLKHAEQIKLFELMQPMKAVNKLKEILISDLKREPSEGELSARMNMTVHELRRQMKIGQAARNKVIKHNLRLVIFVLNKYLTGFVTDENYNDLCQAGLKGLIIAVERFEQKRGFRISTYSHFWIRHYIIRSMTKSSLIHYPMTFESLKQEIQKAKINLMFDLDRPPTDEEIAKSVGITLERYQDVEKAMRPIHSLNAKHPVTHMAYINVITDAYGFSGDKGRKESPVLLRLALDDVLDSLKPKESIVIRQKFGLDGKGERSLAEIGRNLNISREMARKHELKAFMKLKHPTRLDYLRQYL